jgi:hypothetical protein
MHPKQLWRNEFQETHTSMKENVARFVPKCITVADAKVCVVISFFVSGTFHFIFIVCSTFSFFFLYLFRICENLSTIPFEVFVIFNLRC